MAKLFPPIIEGIVPAFYDDEKGMIKVVIPFSMNRAVSQVQVKGLAVKIKTVQSSNYLYTGKITSTLDYELEDSCWAQVRIDKSDVKMRTGQFYKFQLAYIGVDGEVGYYSTVGVGKYTTQPKIEINGLTKGEINTHAYKYMGHYSQVDGDTSETEYSYQFDVYDNNNKVVYTTGELLHNSSNDTELYESYDDFFYSSELPIDTPYRIKYTVNTINGLSISSYRYRIMQKLTIDPEINATLQATVNYDNGYVVINLVGGKDDNGLEEPATGAFLLTRACADDDYSSWDEISRFKLAAQIPSIQLWKDYTIEQGKKYKYSLQQYNDNGLYSNRLYSNEIYGDFEDAFLYDGQRQLKIKYNPKVSSFKRDLLETKVETIGSKHPFILRNGSVDYKEFPISGLISYYMDEENNFIDIQEHTTNLTGENIAQEREFKMKVYEWLTNGEAKLFRSPGEGNFIVRLMNVSLSPNDTLGRMLHTFSATAYEVAEYNYSNLNDFNFIHLDDPEIAQLRFETIDMGKGVWETLEDGTKQYRYLYADEAIINTHPVYTVRFTDMNPGDKILLTFASDKDPEEIQIGVTGSYYVDLGVAITAIQFGKNTIPKGSMTYSYYSVQSNVFDKIDNVHINEVPGRQFIGHHDVLQEIEYIQDYSGNWVKNPKIDLLDIYALSAQRRSIEKITKYNGKYYKDKDHTIELEENKDIFTLYACGNWVQKKEYKDVNDPSYKPYDRFNWDFKIDYYIDFSSGREREVSYEPYIWINGSQVSVEDIRDFSLTQIGKVKSLICGSGCTLELSYQIRNIEYSIEDSSAYEVKIRKQQYQATVKDLSSYLNQPDNIDDISEFAQTVKNKQALIDSNYQSYVLELIKAQEEEKKQEGTQ